MVDNKLKFLQLVVKLLSIWVRAVLNHGLANLIASLEINSARWWPLIIRLVSHARWNRRQLLVIHRINIVASYHII